MNALSENPSNKLDCSSPTISSSRNDSNDAVCDNHVQSCSFSDENLSVFPSRFKGLKVCSHNINRISNKIDELRLLLECDSPPVDVYGISETFLTSSAPDNMYTIGGYQMIRKDRKYSGGGGIIVYLKDGISYKHRPDLEVGHQTIEALWLELNFANKSFLLAQIYRPPRNDHTSQLWLDYMEHTLQNVYAENKSLVIMGDFNIDLLKPSPLGKKWGDIYDNLGVSQLISKPTRVTATTQTLIDHIYVSEDITVMHCDVVDYGISDHYPVFVVLDMKNNLYSKTKSSHYEIKYRNFTNYDQIALQQDLLNAQWPNCYALSVDEAVELFASTFNTVTDKHFPLISKRVKRPKQPGWMNADIRKCMNLREGSKRKGLHNDYKFYRNLTSIMIKEAKSTHYKQFIEDNKANPGKLANLFKELSGKNNSHEITSLIYDGVTCSTDKPIADAFNSHFSKIAEKLNSINPITTTSPDLTLLHQFVQSKVPCKNYFRIPLMTEAHVKKFLKNLNSKKACGLDDISATMVKLTGPYIAHVLMQLCNHSIINNTFPSSWKLAKVVPVHKRLSKDDPNNYRPISILPILSKLLERHVSDYLLEFLTVHDLIATKQSGFRPKHSCETALHIMLDELLCHIQNNEIVGLLFVDFCKAFDLVDHQLLLEKLKIYNFHKDSLAWFTSYLSDRKQCVKISNCISGEKPIKCGVPQGSILGPILFLIYINDLPLQSSLQDTCLFADDATNLAHSSNVSHVETLLQSKVDNINKWCASNKMVLNTDKTKTMLIASQQKLRSITNSDDCLNITVQGTHIEQVTSEKMLGVLIDNSLTWNQQVQKVKKTVLFKIHILRKIKKYLPLNIRKMFYNYYIKPHLDYCCSVWGETSKKNHIILTKLQKQAARLILDKVLDRENSTPSAEMFENLQWNNFTKNVAYQQTLLVYKSVNNLAPPYMKNMFKFTQDTGRPSLRSKSSRNLFIPRAHSKSIRCLGPKLWNKLGIDIKNAKSVRCFKTLYKNMRSENV